MTMVVLIIIFIVVINDADKLDNQAYKSNFLEAGRGTERR